MEENEEDEEGYYGDRRERTFNKYLLHEFDPFRCSGFYQIPRAFFYFLEKFSPPQTGEFFESQKEEHFHFSKNSPGETGTSFCLKKEFEHRENGRKEIRTSDLYS